MTLFPDSPLDVQADLLLAGTWTSVSSRMDHGPVSISRGHPDESTTVSPSTLSLTLSNTDGGISSVNPSSPYYPSLVRNTPLRVSIPSVSPYLRLEDGNKDRAYVNDTGTGSPLSISGSIEMRMQLDLSDWQGCVLAEKWDVGACWYWVLNPNGTMGFAWYDSGSVFRTAGPSTAAVPTGTQALRVTMDATTGTVTYYTGTTIGGTWTQLGAAVTIGAATSIAVVHTSALAIGYSFSGLLANVQMYGRVYEYKLYNGIGGTVAADGVFSSQSAGATSWTDSAGNTWQLAGGAEISSRDYRAHVEVAEWPQTIPPVDSQSATLKPVLVPLVGGGLLRRLGQRNNPVQSAMTRAWVKTGTDLAAYWPLEDTAGAQSLASGIGGTPAAYTGALELAENSDFVCSSALPVLNGAVITGAVGAYDGTWNGNEVSWLMEVPSAGEANGADVMRVATTGTVALVTVTYGTGGSLTITGYSSSGTQLFTSGAIGFAVNGQLLLMTIALTVSGSSVNWALEAATPGATAFAGTTGSISSASVGPVTSWTMNAGGQLLQTVAGHVAVQAAASIYDVTAFGPALAAWEGEQAGTRFARLCAEEGIPFRAGGYLEPTVAMGIQAQETLTTLLQDCADASRGVWWELRQQLGWGFIPPSALYNQAAQVAVTYGADNLSPFSSAPTEDDQVSLNDETITQANGGSSARVYAAPGQPVTGGRLSTLAPPAGMGTYDDAQSYNIANIADLSNVAGWMVHVGTTDSPRFPGIVLDLANRQLAAMFWQVLALDIGGLLTIAVPPSELGANTIGQLAQQLKETLWSDQLKITMAGIPALAWQVAQDGSVVNHADTAGSQLAAPYTHGGTTLSVATTSGPLWSTSGADVPFDIGVSGQRITVTNVAGASSPQTFTVTPGVNGVTTNLASGDPVAAWYTPVAAL